MRAAIDIVEAPERAEGAINRPSLLEDKAPLEPLR